MRVEVARELAVCFRIDRRAVRDTGRIGRSGWLHGMRVQHVRRCSVADEYGRVRWRLSSRAAAPHEQRHEDDDAQCAADDDRDQLPAPATEGLVAIRRRIVGQAGLGADCTRKKGTGTKKEARRNVSMR